MLYSLTFTLPPANLARGPGGSIMSPTREIVPPQLALLAWLVVVLPNATFGWIPVSSRGRFLASKSQWSASAGDTATLPEPDESSGGRFGTQEFWDEAYRSGELNESGRNDLAGLTFSWYCRNWEDLEPFFAELVPDREASILIPGVGNDAAICEMFDAGYEHLSAFDYASEGVELARNMFGEKRLEKMDLRVADARDLVDAYSDDSFDAVLEKGTLDSVYLSGGKDKEKARRNLSMAVSELARVVKPGGVVFSITAACADSVNEVFSEDEGTKWKQIRDGEFYMTEDGYTSTNIDATMYAWERI